MNFPVKLIHIMVLTGEPSGDVHASHLVREIKGIDNQIYFSGIGGIHLENQGVDLFYNISKLSAMGLTEVIMQFAQIKKAFDLFKKKLETNMPDLIILVDYPGFNLKAAQFAKDHYNINILYYITPKVWAWNRSRLKKIKKYIDHAALILPFEEKLYKKAGVPATYVGNPLVDEYPENLPKILFPRDSLVSKGKGPVVIGLLPGSRKAEIKNLLDIMIKAARLISLTHKNIHFMISKAESITRASLEEGLKKYGENDVFQIKEGPVKDIFLKSDLVIAASGTVTLEAALCCIPTIVVYKMSPFSYRVAKLLVRVKYAGLANLIVDAEVMPELLQNDATPEKISKKALYMLDNQFYFQHKIKLVRKLLGPKGASKRTAKIAIHMLKSSKLPFKFDKLA